MRLCTVSKVHLSRHFLFIWSLYDTDVNLSKLTKSLPLMMCTNCLNITNRKQNRRISETLYDVNTSSNRLVLVALLCAMGLVEQSLCLKSVKAMRREMFILKKNVGSNTQLTLRSVACQTTWLVDHHSRW